VTLFERILEWTKSDLSPWQADAVRRLFQQDSVLTDADYDELCALLKAAHGVSCPLELEPIPLSEAHLPVLDEAGEPVLLKAMHDLSNVNRLCRGETLTFSTEGITVIYGPQESVSSSGPSGGSASRRELTA
jgi:hypothetical protein